MNTRVSCSQLNCQFFIVPTDQLVPHKHGLQIKGTKPKRQRAQELTLESIVSCRSCFIFLLFLVKISLCWFSSSTWVGKYRTIWVSCHTHIPNCWLHPESRLKLQGAASSLTTLKSGRGALTAVSAEPSPGMLRSGCITSASMLCKAAATTQVPCGIGCLG